MPLEHHPLLREFPEFQQQIHDLKLKNAEFRQLFNEYHEVDQEIFRHEQDSEPVADQYLEPLKKRRVQIKDRLYQWLRNSSEA